MTPAEYTIFCREDEDECRTLLEAVSVCVSSFFRDPSVFDTIAERVLPRLLAEVSELRVWSAGCAAGEEAFSIAILIRETLEKHPEAGSRSLVFATDINREVLKKADRAVYPRESLVDTRLGIVDRYFSPAGREFELSRQVRDMVHFSDVDLLSLKGGAPTQSIYGSFDLVLCRNVLIYYSRDYQRRIMKTLYASLSAGGYLVLGESEGMCRRLEPRLRTVDASKRIYRR